MTNVGLRVVSNIFIALALFTSSCAISSKSNSVATNTLEVKNYTEIDEKDQFASLTFNIPLVAYTANRHSVSVPLGFNTNYTHAKYGYINGKYENEIKVIAIQEGEQDLARNNALFSSEYNLTYCFPVYNSIKTIDKQELKLGQDGDSLYYAIMPTKILRRFGLRGGYSVQANSFVDNGYQQYVNNFGGYPLGELDGMSSQKSSELRFGISYQEAINTSFLGIAKGKEFDSKTRQVFTIYFDIGLNLKSKFNDLSYPYFIPDPNGSSFDSNDTEGIAVLNPSFFYSKKPIGTVLGVQNIIGGGSFWSAVNAEVGFLSGYYSSFMDSFFIDLKLSFGFGLK